MKSHKDHRGHTWPRRSAIVLVWAWLGAPVGLSAVCVGQGFTPPPPPPPIRIYTPPPVPMYTPPPAPPQVHIPPPVVHTPQRPYTPPQHQHIQQSFDQNRQFQAQNQHRESINNHVMTRQLVDNSLRETQRPQSQLRSQQQANQPPSRAELAPTAREVAKKKASSTKTDDDVRLEQIYRYEMRKLRKEERVRQAVQMHWQQQLWQLQ